MKIVCDNCATKYSIADEKVRGKVFKIRCKKCSHVIVVRGNEGGGVSPSEQSSADLGSLDGAEETTVAPAATPAAGSGSGDSVWHLVIDREQVGPMTPAEVRAKFAAGQVDAETYAWREGFGDWLRLGSIEDFRDLNTASPAKAEAPSSAGEEGATRRTDAADVFASHQAKHAADEDDGGAADLFGGGQVGAEAPTQTFAAPVMAASSSSADDLFSGAPEPTRQDNPRSPAPASARSAAAPQPSTSSLGDLVSDSSNGSSSSAKLTGQRNENSVLFSLNNLQALATGKSSGPSAGGGGGGGGKDAPAPRPGYASAASEGSGLIDIRAMAAQTLSASPSSGGMDSSSDIPMTSAPVFSPVVAAPILMPTPQTGMPKWVFGVIGGGVLTVGGIVVLLIVLLMKKPEPQYVQYTPPPGTTNVPIGTAPPTTTPTPTGTTTPPATATGKTPETTTTTASADKDDPKKSGKSTKSSSGTKTAKSEKTSTKSETTASNPPPAKETKTVTTTSGKKKGGDDLDDLLNRASPGDSSGSKHKAAEPAEDANMPESLTKDDVKAGLASTTPKAKGCYGTYHVPGTALAALTIAKGKITAIEVKGVLAGTPTGDCVAKALKSTSFKKAKNSQSIVWPVILP